MSWTVYLVDPDEGSSLNSKNSIQEGGTQVVGGTNSCELNITYNYSPLYYKVFPNDEGLKWLEGKTGREVRDDLRIIIECLGTKRNDDYWKPTMGNAGIALSILRGWAREHPDGVFKIY